MQTKRYYHARARREQEKSKRKERTDRLLAWFKEWSGVITALIAILYTFPFDAVLRIQNYWNKDLIEARATLSKISELNAEKILAGAKIQNSDARTASFLAGTFDIRIYNALVKEKDIFPKVNE